MKCDIINPVRDSAAGFESNMIATQERDQILTQNSSVKENTLYNTYKCSGFYKIRTTIYRRNRGAIIEFE